MAIASILHRISGVILFLLFPLVLFILSQSLISESSFAHVNALLAHSCSKLMVWSFGAALIYHLLAGIRHLLTDIGLGEGLDAARRSAVLVIVLAIILIIFLGIWIW
jgi:succinate dehydrogenase / fumarate reductase cytochrome b subunit